MVQRSIEETQDHFYRQNEEKRARLASHRTNESMDGKLKISKSYQSFMPSNCPVMEYTADNIYVGVCTFHLKHGVCPRHGKIPPPVPKYNVSDTVGLGCLIDMKKKQRIILSALHEVNKEISQLSRGRDNIYASGLAPEGYQGGYRDALNDCLLLLGGTMPNTRGYWPVS